MHAKLDTFGSQIVHIQVIANRFGSDQPAICLRGGQGSTFRSGSIIIKQADSEVEGVWLAETFQRLASTHEIRVPKPVLSVNGRWIEEGYVAWSFVQGEYFQGGYREKLLACDAYSKLLEGLAKPPFLTTRMNAWSVADRKAWGEESLQYEQEFLQICHGLLIHVETLDLSAQVIHGDFSGNVLFADGLPPAVIDFSPYWRPADFAKAVILMDAAVWDRTVSAKDLSEFFATIENIRQLGLRAALRRIFEQFEHIKMRGRNRLNCLAEATKYQIAFDKLFGKDD